MFDKSNDFISASYAISQSLATQIGIVKTMDQPEIGHYTTTTKIWKQVQNVWKTLGKLGEKKNRTTRAEPLQFYDDLNTMVLSKNTILQW